MTHVIAIDPGLTIGLAEFGVSDNGWFAWSATQTPDIMEALDWCKERRYIGSTVVIEDYISAGHLTKEAKETIKRLGFLQWSLEYTTFEVELATPQKRKAHVKEATTLCGTREIEGPHSWDAMAHALAWMRRNNVPNPIPQ